ncbi:unnamed protein product, partial [Mesorhabditis belari]|uniref:Uncharacterized protein n=1 Tax=Mesorhabditis belari TaxID=2138241 RepID=A0AAF3FBV7_9BILA
MKRVRDECIVQNGEEHCGKFIGAHKQKGLPCRIVVFNADDETMIGDVISATKTVFANSRKRQTRKGMDFPDDLADSVADEGSATNEIDRGESLTVEEMSHLKATEQESSCASILPRITHHRRAIITKYASKRDDGSMTSVQETFEEKGPIDKQEFAWFMLMGLAPRARIMGTNTRNLIIRLSKVGFYWGT